MPNTWNFQHSEFGTVEAYWHDQGQAVVLKVLEVEFSFTRIEHMRSSCISRLKTCRQDGAVAIEEEGTTAVI